METGIDQSNYNIDTFKEEGFKPVFGAAELIPETDAIHKTIKKIPVEHVMLSERSLEELIGEVNLTLRHVKISFWAEFHSARFRKSKMDMQNVWEPIVTYPWWHMNVLKNPLHCAWVLCPPTDEIVIQKEMLIQGLKRIRTVFEQPLLKVKETREVEKNGKETITRVEEVNVPFLKELHSIVRTLQDRVYGSVTQHHRIDSRSITVKTTPEKMRKVIPAKPKELEVPDMPVIDHTITLDQLDAYEQSLSRIEEKVENAMKSGPVIIDVDESQDA